jgi:hypothetical protein
MNPSPARILAVTAGLVAGGALFGGLAGAVALTLLLALFGDFNWDLLLLAARMGAWLGAFLLPIAGWTLMRRVPLWRALAGTIVGTVIGGLLGTALGLFLYPFGLMVGPPLGGILGFIYATIRLRRRFPAMHEAEAIPVPRGAGA